MSRLVIASIGPASSVQDGGRHGAQRYGLTVSGAMDRLSLAAANTLVGNEPFAAVVEIGPFGATFTAKDGLDRWIYGAFALGTLAAAIHYRQIPILAGWRF